MKQLVRECRKALGPKLVSVIQYGTEGEPNNVLIVAKNLEFPVLDSLKPIVQGYVKRSGVVPVLFTRAGLRDGADVFPLEFLDMTYPHTVLHGPDVLKTIRFERQAVRRQLEFELRSKLIHLRAQYLWVKHDKDLRALLQAAVPTLMPLFYGLLFMKRKQVPAGLEQLYAVVEQAYDVELTLFRLIRRGAVKDEDLRTAAHDLMELLESLIETVDKMR